MLFQVYLRLGVGGGGSGGAAISCDGLVGGSAARGIWSTGARLMFSINVVGMPDDELEILRRYCGAEDLSEIVIDEEEDYHWRRSDGNLTEFSREEPLLTLGWSGALCDEEIYFMRNKVDGIEGYIYFVDASYSSGDITIVGVGDASEATCISMIKRFADHDPMPIPPSVTTHAPFIPSKENLLGGWRTGKYYEEFPLSFDEDFQSCNFSIG